MSNFRFGYCYAGKVSDTAVIARAIRTALICNVDYISSAIIVAYSNGCSQVSVEIWPDELKGSIPEFLTDYMAFVKFCNKALQEDKYD
jgi:hypothetical protein